MFFRNVGLLSTGYAKLVISQKMELFITIVVKTSDHTVLLSLKVNLVKTQMVEKSFVSGSFKAKINRSCSVIVIYYL
jgi:hypothetical protein